MTYLAETPANVAGKKQLDAKLRTLCERFLAGGMYGEFSVSATVKNGTIMDVYETAKSVTRNVEAGK